MSKPSIESLEEIPNLGGLAVYRPSIGNFYLKMLVYGPPGVGKTTLSGSAQAVAEMQEALVVNAEAGTLALTDPKVLGVTTLPAIVNFDVWGSLATIHTSLKAGNHPYKTVVIDSLSELQKYNLDYVVATTPRDKRKDEDDIFVEDYGKSTKMMRRTMRNFRDLPMHVIYICHDAPTNSKVENSKIGPALTPAFMKSALGMVDVVGYMYASEKEVGKTSEDKPIVETVRKLLTKPTLRYEAKDRSPGGKLPKIMENPTMKEIMDYITGRKVA